MSPKRPPRAPILGVKSTQERAKSAPRRAKSAPRAAQEAKKGARKVTMFGSALGMASGRPPGAILASFGSLRGSICPPPESNFGIILGAFCGHVFRSEVKRSARNFNARHVPSLLFLGRVHCFFGSELCSKEPQANVGNDPSSKR